MKLFTFLAWMFGLLGPLAGSAQAQLTAGEGFAIIVGSNEGGPGQAALRYAEADTERVSQLLTSLGGYRPERVERLLQPTVSELRAAIERVRERVQPLAANGTQSRFFFYYSGHARSEALNLGREQLPLGELRERITALPATLSIVVLDACQSGAFSRAKGAERAADFSFNSVERLNTAGIAVIASSNARELSQESEELKSSYFTHHWLVGLRGAGDGNADGRVTLSEAYQYAYNHTLATTAQTSVGEQHATLETNLTGQDEVPLTQPSAARAQLVVPADFEGRILLQMLPSWSVLAELDKAHGKPITLALPAGDYAATVRQRTQAARCTLELRDGVQTQLLLQQCTPLVRSRDEVKGDRQAIRDARSAAEQLADLGKDEKLFLEIGPGFATGHDDTRYITRLQTFSFSQDEGTTEALRLAIAAGYRLLPNLAVGLSYLSLQSREYDRFIEVTQTFAWDGHGLFAFVQGDLNFGRRRLLTAFGRLGVGGTWVESSFDAIRNEHDFSNASASLENTTIRTEKVTEHFVRPAGYASVGLQIMPSRFVGVGVELRYLVAPGIENLFGETHDLGGLMFGVGLRLRTWER